MKLAELHDLCILTETRETNARRQYTLDNLPAEYSYFSSGISARKGGIAVLVKRSFLDNFLSHSWEITSTGRVGCLHLTGKHGTLNIIAVYLDPASVHQQMRDIKSIRNLLDADAHNIVCGDWNFVEHPADRVCKNSASPAATQDRRVTDEWNRLAQESNLQEFLQPEFTCETSHGWSRIDRIYTNMHKADLLNSRSHCRTLEHPRNLSDHSPVSFGYQKIHKRQGSNIPSWIATHPDFEEEVNRTMETLTERFEMENSDKPSATEALALLKMSIRKAAGSIRKKDAESVACTTAHKLAATLSFIRSIEAGDYKKAEHIQKRFTRLEQCKISSTTRSSREYLAVKNLAVEMMQVDLGDRIRELKACREQLTEDIYRRRKDAIAARLKKLIPAGPKTEIVIIKDNHGNYHNEAKEIAEILTLHWQTVFDQKPTDADLRKTWLSHVTDRLKTTVSELRPTGKDVEKVFKNLRESAAGPDGISSMIYAALGKLAPGIFLRIVTEMLDGTATFDDAFNQAFLCCIPKTADEVDNSGTPVFSASSTRPISIVDAANRIIAAILAVALERCVGTRISEMQKGFLFGRQMMENLIDIDVAAQKISVRSSSGAIVLLDFRAAFPSMDHDFIWDTLLAVGLPANFICAVKLLYRDNVHFLRLQGQLFEGPSVHSGVRQGCPLSGILFAICADVLLIRIRSKLQGVDEVVRAFADDTAAAVNDLFASLVTLADLFEEYANISGLELNIKKTVVIPLWPLSNVDDIKRRIGHLCPSWKNVGVDNKGRYLGFIIGPGANEHSWEAAMRKYKQRVTTWSKVKCGLFWTSIYYNLFVSSTLDFLSQLEDIPEWVQSAETEALRKLAPGPGNWITMIDLENLSKFGIGNGFRTLKSTALAAKLRLLRDLGKKKIQQRAEEIRIAQMDSLRRPLGMWHQRSFAKRLCDTKRNLHDAGVQMDNFVAKQANFQKTARSAISSVLFPYDPEQRIRAKAARWKFRDSPRHVAQRLLTNFKVLQTKVPPAVRATYLRALWNGVPTSRRMATCKNFQAVSCLFKCTNDAEDSLEHYCRCPVLRAAFAKLTTQPAESLDDFFGTKRGLCDEDRIAIASRVRVTCRLVQLARSGRYSHYQEVAELQWRKCGNFGGFG